MEFNYVRVLISGGKTAAPAKEHLSALANKQYVKKVLPLVKIKNISLYNKYKSNFENAVISGYDDIYGAEYTGIIFEQYTGKISIVDHGFTDKNGLYKAEGFNTGSWIEPIQISPKFNQPIFPVYTTPEGLRLPRSSSIIYPKDLDTTFGSKPGDIFEGKILTSPFAYRSKVYSGVYGGSLNLKDTFYDTEKQSLSFVKNVPYLVTGTDSPTYEFLTVRLDSPGTGALSIPGSIIINNALVNGSGMAFYSGSYILSGKIPNFPLPRNNLSGVGNITGKLTGVVLPENSGKIIFNKYATGMPEFAYQAIAGHSDTASGILIFDNPINDDYFIISSEIDDELYYTLTFSDDPVTYEPPLYFDSIFTLNKILNSGNKPYKVSSEIINLNNLGYTNKSGLLLKATYAGNSGNYINIETNAGSRLIMNNQQNLTGGYDYYENLTPTGVFSGYLKNKEVNATGIFVADFADYVYQKIIKNVGYKTFTGIWRIYGSEDNIVFNNLKDFENLQLDKIGTKATELQFDPSNSYILRISYGNNSKSYDIDQARLKVFRNNEEKASIIIKGQY